jgi:predicted TIM-barrel fold metal-dependent hydrolase
MSRTYRLIDADQHINEPPDLWTSRLSAKFRDRAPRMERFEQGDAWVFEGVKDPINFGLNACAGMEPDKLVPWLRWEELRRGGYDPAVRCDEMDRDGVDACLLFPTPRVSQWMFAMREPDFHLELVQAYNDWLSEYCAHDPERLGGLFVIPNRGVDQALAEIDRASKLPGMRGALMGCYPHGDLELQEEDDAVWQALVDRDLPLHIHVALVNDLPAHNASRIPGDLRIYDAPKRIMQFVWGGVFDRIPELKLVFVEVDCGWVPYLKEQADDRFHRQAPGIQLKLRKRPSEYVRDHMWFAYITDHYGIRNRHDIGVNKILWSSDFPHVGANWPNSSRVIAADMSGIPEHERDAMLAGNAQALYGFGR